MAFYIIIGLTYLLAIGTAAFFRPNQVFKRSAIAAASAITLPFIMAYTIGPLLGDGAGMGVAAMLYISSAAVLLTALAASVGGCARLLWTSVLGR